MLNALKLVKESDFHYQKALISSSKIIHFSLSFRHKNPFRFESPKVSPLYEKSQHFYPQNLRKNKQKAP